MDLSVVIVSFNTRAKLRKCLEAVFASRTNFAYEVFVVDNASSDGSAEEVRANFPAAKLIANLKNSGYAKANNMALLKAQGRYCLLLNSDVIVTSDTFDKLLQYMDNDSTVGIVGCKVVKPDGSLDLACRRSFPNLRNSLFRMTGLSFLFPKSKFASYNLTFLPENEIAEVDSVMGAFLLIRRDVIDKIGLLDEQYFMYGEDLDWCYRAKLAGFRVVYAPITSVLHDKGSSSRKLPRRALYEFHRAMWTFYRKHYAERYNFLINGLVNIGIWTRYGVKFLENLIRSEQHVSK